MYRAIISLGLLLFKTIDTLLSSSLKNSDKARKTSKEKFNTKGFTLESHTKSLCHTRFRKDKRMHPICAPGSSSAHTDVTSEYPKQCINEKEYNSTLLHDRQS
jgi:hypothetical protein